MEKYSANEVIEIAVQIERSGYEYYQQALKRHDLDEETKKLLVFLGDQEKKHEQQFLKMRNDIDKIDLESSSQWNEVTGFLKTIVASRIFSDPESAIYKAQNSNSKAELLKNAMQFEKDTLLYYHSLHSLTGEEHVKDTLEEIIVEEMSHIVRLGLFLDKWHK